MKYTAPLAAMAIAATTAAEAGTLTEPEVEAAVETAAAAGSAQGWLLPILALGVIAAVASSSSDEDEGSDTAVFCIGPGVPC